MDSLRRGVHLAQLDTNVIQPELPVKLGGSCQVSRTVFAGLAGTLGFLIGELGAFPFALNDGASSSTNTALGVAGAAAALVLFADAPLSRPLPLCPAEMRTLANRPSDHVAACRASRVLSAGLGAATGTLVALVGALPFALANTDSHVRVQLIVLPAAGALLGGYQAGERPPCSPG